MTTLKSIAKSLENGEHIRTSELTQQAIAEGLGAGKILDDGLIAGMNVVGDKFRQHQIFLPDVLLAARAMYAGLEHLEPLLVEEGIPSRGKVVLGSVRGDLHDIGKNLVGIMLRGVGYEIVDLGNDVAPEQFVDAAVESEAGVIGMSALLTTTMPVMAEVMTLLEERGLGEKIRVMVGGAPVTAEFAEEIGADAYGFDAANAVDVVQDLVSTL